MHRFFVPPDWIKGDFVTLSGDVARQISKVLRMSVGDKICLLDDSGNEYGVVINKLTSDFVHGDVTGISECQGEPHTKIILYQAILKGEKFEVVLQKCTELGVYMFVPVMCRRSVPQQREERQMSRYKRWKRIVVEAAEQSGRCRLPELGSMMSFKDACDQIEKYEMSLIPWEKERHISLQTMIRGNIPEYVAIFIGPEGGFDDSEVSYARSCGASTVTLGERVLRSDTAALATVTMVMYQSGNMGM